MIQRALRGHLEQRKHIGILEDMIIIGKIAVVSFGTKQWKEFWRKPNMRLYLFVSDLCAFPRDIQLNPNVSFTVFLWFWFPWESIIADFSIPRFFFLLCLSSCVLNRALEDEPCEVSKHLKK